MPEAVGEGGPGGAQLRVYGQVRVGLRAARVQQALGKHDGLLVVVPAQIRPEPVQELGVWA